MNPTPQRPPIVPSRNFDYVIVGSGINSLVAAAMLERKGHEVLVLERNDEFGGCLKTGEVTQPGFVHDVMAMTVVLFSLSPGYRILGADLRRHGLEILRSEKPTGVLLPLSTNAQPGRKGTIIYRLPCG